MDWSIQQKRLKFKRYLMKRDKKKIT